MKKATFRDAQTLRQARRDRREKMTAPGYREALEHAILEARGAAQAVLDAIDEMPDYLADPKVDWGIVGSLNHIVSQLEPTIAYLNSMTTPKAGA